MIETKKIIKLQNNFFSNFRKKNFSRFPYFSIFSLQFHIFNSSKKSIIIFNFDNCSGNVKIDKIRKSVHWNPTRRSTNHYTSTIKSLPFSCFFLCFQNFRVETQLNVFRHWPLAPCQLSSTQVTTSLRTPLSMKIVFCIRLLKWKRMWHC